MLIRFLTGCLLTGSLLVAAPAAQALTPMNTQTINQALLYGMKGQDLDLAYLYGPNWIEGDNGALLLVNSPFMILASKAANGGFPKKPRKKDLKEARKRYGKWVAYYEDSKNRHEVKFAVSFFGKTPEFAQNWNATIVGVGRGKEFVLEPSDVKKDKLADERNTANGVLYEAINGYYFRLKDLLNIAMFHLVMKNETTGETMVFKINGSQLY